ncbi:uncharacterized protein TNCT_426181 [Trichonephila clavata]|uniref:Uncharacterized protein n=1 Tax=Trichonephila clavata TaxID=2740835 RepID=A0A8X6HG14_TRICU|nr:uncharacterized protein TNCT_426181 [Trichonephila clavata]
MSEESIDRVGKVEFVSKSPKTVIERSPYLIRTTSSAFYLSFMQEKKDVDESPEISIFRSSTVREERRMSDFDLWDMLLFGARRPKIKTPPVVPFK